MTHFRRGYSYQDLVRRSSIYLADLGGLAGARVTVYQSRERYPHLQTAEHTRFWEHYFEGAGVGELQILVL